jgi:hypothetical protein
MALKEEAEVLTKELTNVAAKHAALVLSQQKTSNVLHNIQRAALGQPLQGSHSEMAANPNQMAEYSTGSSGVWAPQEGSFSAITAAPRTDPSIETQLLQALATANMQIAALQARCAAAAAIAEFARLS